MDLPVVNCLCQNPQIEKKLSRVAGATTYLGTVYVKKNIQYPIRSIQFEHIWKKGLRKLVASWELVVQ